MLLLVPRLESALVFQINTYDQNGIYQRIFHIQMIANGGKHPLLVS